MGVSLSRFTSLPTPAKVGVATVGGGGVMYGVHMLLGWRGLALILLGALFVGLILLGYALLLRRGRKRRANQLSAQIKRGCVGAPQGVTQAEMIARLDDLRQRFEEGMEAFNRAGKNIYSLPWYMLVGEPGSGKTEAVRNSNVGFPPGLHDEFQGVGGTINMNWWFTNYAVILDTAGRLMFEDVEAGRSSEWKEFLALLKRSRPGCPINGMLLVIPADSLIKDTAEEIESKGAKIAQQFDAIQRSLDIRFPVFVLVTKCDLVNGFREFFDSLRDPQLQHQMTGWSNPAPIDEPFQPDRVTQHLETVRQRLFERRLVLLGDIDREHDPDGRQLDQVDTLYDFPHSFSKLGPRLKRYLQIIFAAGEWSTKPLFLRGIYFTSSMREGAALDADLAEALGVPVESLPEGRSWERDRAFFLRDVWVEKAFREWGLVTRATNAKGLARRRRAAIMGAGFVGVALLFLLTWFGVRSLKQSVGTERDLWHAAAHSGWIEQAGTNYWMPLIYRDVDGQFSYGGMTPIEVAGRRAPVGRFHAVLLSRTVKKFNVPWIFRMSDKVIRVAHNEDSLNQLRLQSHRRLFETSVLGPLLGAVREKLRAETPETWSPEAAQALEELIEMEASASAPARLTFHHGDVEQPGLDLDAMFRYALLGRDQHYQLYERKDSRALAKAWEWLYSHKPGWPPASLCTGGGLAENPAVRRGVETHIRHCEALQSVADLQAQMARFEELRVLLRETAEREQADGLDSEKRFLKKFSTDTERIDSLRTYEQVRGDWTGEYERLGRKVRAWRDRVDAIEALFDTIPLLKRESIATSYRDAIARSSAELQACLGGLSLPARAAVMDSLVDSVAEPDGSDGEYDIPDSLFDDEQPKRETRKEETKPVRQVAPLVAEVRAEIEKATDAAREAQRVREGMADPLEEADRQFKAMQSALAALENRFGIYAVADGQLRTEDALPERGKVLGIVEGVTDGTREAELTINRRLDPDDELADPAAEVAKIMCSLAAKGRMHRVLEGAILGSAGRPEAIAEAIGREAARLDPLRRPAVPLTEMASGAFLGQYHPEAAAAFFDEWAVLGRAVRDPGLRVLDRKGLEGLYGGRDGVHDEYVQMFAKYWAETIPRDLQVKPLSWAEFDAQLDALTVRQIQESLAQFCDRIDKLFSTSKDFGSYISRGKVGAIRERARSGMRRVESATFNAECQTVLKSWTDLPRDALLARETVLVLQSQSFSRGYLVRGTDAEEDFVVQYWQDLTYMMLRALADHARQETMAALRGTKQNAYELFSKMRLAGGLYDDQTLGRGAAVGVARIDEEIERLRLLDFAYELARRLLGSTAGAVEEVEELVAEHAEALEPTPRGEIPLTVLQGGEFEDRYHPKAAVVVFQNWSAVGEMLKDKGIRSTERAELQSLYEDRQGAYDAFAQRFDQYWTSGVLRDWRVREQPWSAFRSALAKYSAPAINQALATSCNGVHGGLASAGDFSVFSTGERLAAVRAMALRGEQRARERAFERQCELVWGNWHSLPGDPFAARDKILSLPPADFAARYRAAGADSKSDLAAWYWESLVQELLHALADQTDKEVRDSVAQLQRYVRFPLDQPGTRAQDLAPSEVVTAATLLGRIYSGGSKEEGATLADGAVTGDERIDQYIQALRGVGVPKAMDAWMSGAKAVLKALPRTSGEVLECKVYVHNMAEQKRLCAREGTFEQVSVLPIWRVISMEQGGMELGRLTTTHRESALLGAVRYPGPKAGFKFWKYPSDETPDWGAAFSEPWSCVRMLHTTGATRSQEDPMAWDIAVRLKDSKWGAVRCLWLRLVFDREFPDIKNWPVHAGK